MIWFYDVSKCSKYKFIVVAFGLYITKEAQVSRANAKCYGNLTWLNVIDTKRHIRRLFSEGEMIDRPVYLHLMKLYRKSVTLNSLISIIIPTFRSQHTGFLPVHWIYSDSESQCWHCRVMYHSWNVTATLFLCSSAVDTLNCHICFHTSAAQRFHDQHFRHSHTWESRAHVIMKFCSAVIIWMFVCIN